MLGVLLLLVEFGRELAEPAPASTPLPLDPLLLPGLALRTTLRMLAAMALSLLFTLVYATWAAKSRRAERLLLPLLDILQSVPILGFLSVATTAFLALAPGRALGAELAAILAIFTSQAWNMAFSFYQSLRTVPVELEEVARAFRMNGWMRFWRLEVPFAMPALVWNMMMSMSGGWFFVVAAEAISVGETTVVLPGIGAWIARAIEERDAAGVAWALATMGIVILLYDRLLFRPLTAWAERFRFEQEGGTKHERSLVLEILRRSRLVAIATAPLGRAWRAGYRVSARLARLAGAGEDRARPLVWLDRAGVLVLLLLGALAARAALEVALAGIDPGELVRVVAAGALTLARVLLLLLLASLLWVPIGVWLGVRPELARIAQPIAQMLAAFPANLLFPIVVSAIVAWRLDPDVWLSPLMILGTQWYILFNVIAGAAAIPRELRDVATNLRVRGWLWWRKVALPAIVPYYLTGAITASGGAWNASIVAELASWGEVRLEAHGLGAYIALATEAGDFHRVVLGIAVMSAFVVGLNRLLWRPLYYRAERAFRLG
ncbi:MAG: ABC transporter permease subunit [Geminicoccaceae bacterium]|nr:ABC transporter permease subunit [Geminicoccaceae bacterium]MCX8102206.1 ABC transporter permease subunit [Geminicoccaceae bacterium]